MGSALAAMPAQANTDPNATPADALSDQRSRFKPAFQAALNGQHDKAMRLAQGMEDYPLYPYIRYEYLWRNMSRADTDLPDFLQAYEGSVLAERLRSRWLKRLANRGRWQDFLDHYRPQRETELKCLQLKARLELDRPEGVARDALPLWLVGKSQPPECDPAFAALYASDLMTPALLWQRINLAMENRKSSLARFIGRKLPAEDQPRLEKLLAAHANPARTLARQDADAIDATNAPALTHAVVRLARIDLDAAIKFWDRLASATAFDEHQRGTAARALAIRATRDKHDAAAELLALVPDSYVDAEIQRSMIRTAVRDQDWLRLEMWTRLEAAPEMNAPRWKYWRARALDETGYREAAVGVLRELAKERDFYGFRAADLLGVEYAMQDRAIPFPPAVREEMLAQPGLARAAELYRLGYVYMGRREWYHETRRMGPEDQTKAAALANHLGWHDRAILTVAKSGYLDDLELRFPTPDLTQDLVRHYATKRKLPEALILSIIKAESAFMEDARSPAGALGLMQVMPATGREVAKRIGYPLKRSDQLLQAKPNITLGSAYLKQMLDRYDGNIAMAAAAYNAGPHRVRAWQPDNGCQSAEDWIELVPFNETRRYVRKTLFHLAVYEWRLKQQVQPLEDRLLVIPARRTDRLSCGLV